MIPSVGSTMRLTKAHLLTFLILFILFAIFNLVAVTANQNFGRGVLTATGTILGPLTGAISRNFQNCRLNASLGLSAYFLPVLCVGIFAQLTFKRTSVGRVGSSIRLALWIVAWALWFFSGIISFGHALS
jgi:hypothetical protein